MASTQGSTALPLRPVSRLCSKSCLMMDMHLSDPQSVREWNSYHSLPPFPYHHHRHHESAAMRRFSTVLKNLTVSWMMVKYSDKCVHVGYRTSDYKCNAKNLVDRWRWWLQCKSTTYSDSCCFLNATHSYATIGILNVLEDWIFAHSKPQSRSNLRQNNA